MKVDSCLSGPLPQAGYACGCWKGTSEMLKVRNWGCGVLLGTLLHVASGGFYIQWGNTRRAESMFKKGRKSTRKHFARARLEIQAQPPARLFEGGGSRYCEDSPIELQRHACSHSVKTRRLISTTSCPHSMLSNVDAVCPPVR